MIRLMRISALALSAIAGFSFQSSGAVVLPGNAGSAPTPDRVLRVPATVTEPAAGSAMGDPAGGEDFLQQQFAAYVNATNQGLPDVVVAAQESGIPAPPVIPALETGLAALQPPPVTPGSSTSGRMAVEPIPESTTGILGLAGLALAGLVPVAVLLFARDWAFRPGQGRTADGFE